MCIYVERELRLWCRGTLARRWDRRQGRDHIWLMVRRAATRRVLRCLHDANAPCGTPYRCMRCPMRGRSTAGPLAHTHWPARPGGPSPRPGGPSALYPHPTCSGGPPQLACHSCCSKRRVCGSVAGAGARRGRMLHANRGARGFQGSGFRVVVPHAHRGARGRAAGLVDGGVGAWAGEGREWVGGWGGGGWGRLGSGAGAGW
jgi:hypothetical protein